LRSLIKQAINAGKLVRSGKGTRVNYRLAPPETPTIETEAVSEAELVAVIEADVPAEAGVEAESVVIVEPVVVPEEPKPAKPSRSRRKKADPIAAVAPEPEPAVIVEPAAPVEVKPSRSRRKKKPADTEQDG
jgi:ribonuclease E